MIDKEALTSGQLCELRSTKGLTIHLADARKVNELLKAVGFTPEISLESYGEVLDVCFTNPTHVNVGTVLDRNVYTIEIGKGRGEVWLDECQKIMALYLYNVSAILADGKLSIGDFEDPKNDDAPSFASSE